MAVVGAHCDDIAIGAGGTLLRLVRANPDITIHALVLTGGGTEREVEEKNALSLFGGTADVHLAVADFDDGRLPEHWAAVKQRIADFRRECEPDLVIGPHRGDRHQDHRLLAELLPTEFRDHLILGYEILKWESDLPQPTAFVPIDPEDAARKVELLAHCYPTQLQHQWFDEDAFLGLMRIRGAQCHRKYAEGFVADKLIVQLGRSHSAATA